MLGLDPLTMLTIGIGLTMTMAVLLVAYSFEGAGGRRFQRRLARVKGVRGLARSCDKTVRRSLSRTDGKSTGFETIIKQYLPRRELLEERIARTGRPITVSKYVIVSGALALVTMLVAIGLGGFSLLPSLLLGLALGVGLPHWVVGKMGRRRVAAFIHLFPEAIDLMVRALRSGLPISEAMINAGRESTDPVGIELRTIESGLQLGRDLDSLLW